MPETVSPQRAVPAQPRTGAVQPVAVDEVRIVGGPWGELQDLNRAAIIPHALSWMERLGWVANFDRLADGSLGGSHRGREFADTEVYKLLEAMAWDQARVGDRAFEETMADLVTRITAAQDEDGYLQTLFGHPGQAARYGDFVWGHELYCFGHLIQSAVAHARTDGDPRWLATARRVADHVCDEFGPGGRNQVCGHAEIEVALTELYRVTGEPRYLEQARRFIDLRGTGTLPLIEFGRQFYQDDIPVREATTLRGHAVRALYLACGAVDVAVETADDELLAALIRQWESTVARRTYLTGGMGSHHMDEAFGDDFVLPPDRSYCETCAGIASIMFSWRLLLATGEVRYAELIERTLYNIVATSPARDGQSFFYANTLHQRTAGAPAALNDDGVAIRGGSSGREPWFEVSCCPPNLARTIASLSAYALTTSDDSVQIHQYMPLEARVRLGSSGHHVGISVSTEYPRDGRVVVRIDEATEALRSVTLRVPAWADGARLSHGGEERVVDPGSVVQVPGPFAAGDEIVLGLPITPRWTFADSRIDAVRGCVAVERGPEVYCLESVDLPAGTDIGSIVVDTSEEPVEQDGKVIVRVVRARQDDSSWPYSAVPTGQAQDGSWTTALVPYNDWAERGPSTMRIWMPAL